MKELPPDKHHLQTKMKEWLDANQETYSQFKDKVQSVLKESLWASRRVSNNILCLSWHPCYNAECHGSLTGKGRNR